MKFAVVLLSSLVLIGCTITPKAVHDKSPSFDGAQQNSGFIGFTTNGFGVLTPHARDRYNGLIAAGYGTNFIPSLPTDYGITPFTNGTFLITPEALTDFAVMNQLRKSAP